MTNEQLVELIAKELPDKEDFKTVLVVARPLAWTAAHEKKKYREAIADIIEVAVHGCWIWEIFNELRIRLPESAAVLAEFLRVDADQPFRRQVVALFRDGRPVAAGAVINETTIVTSRRAVLSALKLPPDGTDVPMAAIEVATVFCAETRVLQATCLPSRWSPASGLAVLQLAEPYAPARVEIALESVPHRSTVMVGITEDGYPHIERVQFEDGRLGEREDPRSAKQRIEPGSTRPAPRVVDGCTVLFDDALRFVGLLPTGPDRDAKAKSGDDIVDALAPRRELVAPLARALARKLSTSAEMARAIAPIEDAQIPFPKNRPTESWHNIIQYAWRQGLLPGLLLKLRAYGPPGIDEISADIIGITVEKVFDPRRNASIRYPLLSEWLRLRVGRWLLAPHTNRVRGATMVAALVLFVVNVVAIALSSMTESACIEFELRWPGGSVPFQVGYVAELPHGAWSCLGSLCFVLLLARFIKVTTQALRAAQASGRLIVVDEAERPVPGQSVLGIYSSENQKWFGFSWKPRVVGLWLLIVVMPITVIVVAERQSWNAPVFGWVQANKARELDEKSLAQLTQVSRLAVAPPACASQPEICTVHLTSDVQHGSPEPVFGVFVVIALVLQATFSIMGMYAAMKILHFLLLLLGAVRVRDGTQSRAGFQSPTRRLRLQPRFTDPRKRMGLRIFDQTFDYGFWLALLSGIWFCLVALSNDEKGTRFLPVGGVFDFANLGHLVMFIVVFGFFFVLAAIAFWYIDLRCVAIRDQHVERLYEQFPEPTEGQRERAVEERIALAEDQSARPPIKSHIMGMIAVLVVFVIPFALWTELDLGGSISTLRSWFGRDLPGALCRIESTF